MHDAPPDTNPTEDNRADIESDELDISPSVRRLLRQYDVDVTSIRGTGPNGRIRPGDVLGIVGNPQLTALTNSQNAEDDGDASAQGLSVAKVQNTERTNEAAVAPMPGTTVFVCNMAQVLTHRKRTGQGHISIACYVAEAAAAASSLLLPHSNGTGTIPILLKVSEQERDWETVLTGPATTSAAEIYAGLTAVPATTAPDSKPRLAVHHFGLPGSMIDFHPPAPAHEAAVLCIGGLQRTIGLAVTDGSEAPRIVTQCYLALTYRMDEIASTAAARFVSACVRMLESWPLPDALDTTPEPKV